MKNLSIPQHSRFAFLTLSTQTWLQITLKFQMVALCYVLHESERWNLRKVEAVAAVTQFSMPSAPVFWGGF